MANCEMCKRKKPGMCDTCGKKIPVYENMGGNGYQSPKIDHMHAEAVAGIRGDRMVRRELCLGCYRAEWAMVYPDTLCQV